MSGQDSLVQSRARVRTGACPVTIQLTGRGSENSWVMVQRKILTWTTTVDNNKLVWTTIRACTYRNISQPLPALTSLIVVSGTALQDEFRAALSANDGQEKCMCLLVPASCAG